MKTKTGYVLPKKGGGVHKSSKGKVVKYKSKAKAESASRVIMAKEHKKMGKMMRKKMR